MRHQGFTLIETLVAIYLLTVGMAGSFVLIQKTTSFASTSSSQFIASYLAQEGIEIIRNIRDTNFLTKGSAWDEDIAAGSDFRLDYRSSEFPDATCGDYLQYNSNFNFYVCTIDSTSKFQRKITIEKPASDKMVVSIEVSWLEQGNIHKVVAQTELYDWR